MDMNVTVAIPAFAVLLATNSIFQLLRYKNGKDKSNNGNIDRKILEDLVIGHKEFAACFQEIQKSDVRKEVHLENMVSELKNLNSRMNNIIDRG